MALVASFGFSVGIYRWCRNMAKILALIALLWCFVSAGLASPTSRIVGGTYAAKGQFPHQISLRRNGLHNCGGSIISRSVILTAAHCVYGNAPQNMSIRAGSLDQYQGGVVINAAKILMHENYVHNDNSFKDDVALIKLEQKLIYSANIQPAKLATRDCPSGTPVIVSGWGRIKTGGDLPQLLKYNTLMAISTDECYETIGFNNQGILCLAHSSSNGACNGDSGGPAHCNNEVAGIAGFVVNGCGSNYPDGYAKVFHHLDWIKKNEQLL